MNQNCSEDGARPAWTFTKQHRIEQLGSRHKVALSEADFFNTIGQEQPLRRGYETRGDSLRWAWLMLGP